MTSNRSPTRSESLADAAHEALRAGELDKAHALFADAARAEAEAFDGISSDKPRTLGILAVSTAALWFKAGDFDAAEQFAFGALAAGLLPPFAQQALHELLQSIWTMRSGLGSGVSVAPGQMLTLHGNLRALDLDHGIIRLSVEGAPVRILGVGDALESDVGPMVNRDVDVRVVGGDQGDLHLVEIAQSGSSRPLMER